MSIIVIQVVVYVKTRDNSAEWCSVKGTGPSTEPCGTPYESVTLSECLYFLRIGAYFTNKKKTKFGQIFHTKQKVYLLL